MFLKGKRSDIKVVLADPQVHTTVYISASQENHCTDTALNHHSSISVCQGEASKAGTVYVYDICFHN